MGCLAPRWTRRPLPRRARRAQIPRGGAPPLRFDPGSVRRAGEPTNADVAAGKAPAGEFFFFRVHVVLPCNFLQARTRTTPDDRPR